MVEAAPIPSAAAAGEPSTAVSAEMPNASNRLRAIVDMRAPHSAPRCDARRRGPPNSIAKVIVRPAQPQRQYSNLSLIRTSSGGPARARTEQESCRIAEILGRLLTAQ